jgi:hypothetical protein
MWTAFSTFPTGEPHLYSPEARPKIDPTPTPKPTPKPTKKTQFVNVELFRFEFFQHVPVLRAIDFQQFELLQQFVLGFVLRRRILLRSYSPDGLIFRSPARCLARPSPGPRKAGQGFDCSGIVYFCLRTCGVSTSRYSASGFSSVSKWTEITSTGRSAERRPGFL